jgi:PAS domain S-box-containing protein
MAFFRQIFGPGDFMPHGYCYLWNGGLVWLNVISDGLIALAYFSIGFVLLWFVRKRRDLSFGSIFVLFGTFIVACGATHVMKVWNLWHAEYWLAGGLKAVTAIASIATALVLIHLIPKALDLPSVTEWSTANAALEKEIQERRELEVGLRSTAASFREQSEMLELIHDAIFVRNFQNEIVFWNRSAERLYGWKKDEAQGHTSHGLLQTEFPYELRMPVEILVPHSAHSKHSKHRDGYSSSPRPRAMGAGLDLLGRRKNGTEFPVEISLSPLETAGGTLISSSVRDITERKPNPGGMPCSPSPTLARAWT